MQRDYERGRFPTAIIAVIAILVAVVIIIMAVFAYYSSRTPYGYGYYGWGGMMGGWGFPMLFMFPIGIIILILIGYVIYRGVWWGGGCGGHHGYYGYYRSDEERENAMEILRRRYARGEISKEQYEQMKKDIIT